MEKLRKGEIYIHRSVRLNKGSTRHDLFTLYFIPKIKENAPQGLKAALTTVITREE